MNWQRQRSEFNHDWLKNRYLLALGTWLNILQGEVQDPALEAAFLNEILPEWPARSAQASRLIRQFEECMSPRTLLDRPPLRSWDTRDRQWVGALLHELWLFKTPVRKWVDCAERALKRAEAAYRSLVEALEQIAAPKDSQSLRPLVARFDRFHDSCQQLTEALSLLPSEVRLP